MLVYADKGQMGHNEVFEIRELTSKDDFVARNKYGHENKKGHDGKCRKYKEYIEEAISSLVKEGKLDKTKADKVMQYLADREKEIKNMTKEERKELYGTKKAEMLKEMVSKEIITTEEADIIRAKFRELKEKRLNDSLNSLIKKGTITASDAEAVKGYFVNFRKEKAEKFKQLENLSHEERIAYFKSYKREKESIFEKMIKDGVITKAQADELKKALFE
jgi:polyhydroxyalkanoate synthesis regulator phasin